MKKRSPSSRRGRPRKRRSPRPKVKRRLIAARSRKRLLRLKTRVATSPQHKRKRRGAREAAEDNRAIRVLRLVRKGESFSKAARNEHIKPVTAKKRLGILIYRDGPGKRWKAKKSDRLTDFMVVLTELGPVTVPVRGSRQRNLLYRYYLALRKWRGGKPGAYVGLIAFKGKTVGGYPLITDVKLLAALEDADQLDFEELYASLTGGA